MESKTEQSAKVRINVADFKVSDCRKVLDCFGNSDYTYSGKTLYVRYDGGISQREAKGSLILAKRANLPKGDNVVRLSPAICGSFAVWPSNGNKGDNLLEVCKNSILRPQFVFLALNWSNKIQIVGNRRKLSSPADYFTEMPRWNNFHNLSKEAARRPPSNTPKAY